VVFNFRGYINMSYNYGPSYKRLVELIQQGGPTATKAAKQASQSREGYMSPINVSMIESEDADTSLETRLYNRFKEVRDSNEFLINLKNKGYKDEDN
jgi:hypothetical protein